MGTERAARLRSPRSGLAAALLAAALLAVGTACAPQPRGTELVEADHANAAVGDILVRGIFLVASGAGDEVALVGGFVNEGEESERLLSVTMRPGDESAEPATTRTDLELPPGAIVDLGGPADPEVILANAGGVQTGTFVPITLRFREAGPVTLGVLVEDPEGVYGRFAPAS